MKKYFYLLPLIFIGCKNTALPPSTDKTDLHLAGPVQTVTITEYDAIMENGGFVPLDTLTTRTITFSQEGRIEKVVHENGTELYYYEPGCRTIKHFDMDGDPDFDEIDRYDAHGDRVSWGMYGADGTVMSREEYTYADHRSIETHVLTGDVEENLVRRDYRYDDAGHVLAYTAYSPQGTIVYKWNCTYDDHGNPACEHWIDENDSVMSTNHYTYNDHGLIASDQADLYYNTFSYDYDEQGNYIRKITTPSENDERLVYTIETREITYYEQLK